MRPHARRLPRRATTLLPAGIAAAVAAGVLLAPGIAAAAAPTASGSSAAPSTASSGPGAAAHLAWDGVAPTATALIEENIRLAAGRDTQVFGVVGQVVPVGPSDAAVPAAPTTPAAPPVEPTLALMGTGPIGRGSAPERVVALQTRLTWAGITTPPTGGYGATTAASVRRWQEKRNMPATGRADAATVRSLANATSTNGLIDPRCHQPGVTICVDKTEKVLRFYVDGTLEKQFDVNVGPERGQKEYGRYSSTRVGSFTIVSKERFKVSSLYGTPMHYFMPFDGGIAFHNSRYFLEAGYQNSSYGCVTAGPVADSKWLFDHAAVGTRVVVHA